MSKKHVVGISLLGFVLFCWFSYYMLTDEELSGASKYWLEQPKPTKNLDNNVFIHMMTIGDRSVNSYETAKNNYLSKVQLAKSTYLDMSTKVNFPSALISENDISADLFCVLNEDGCLTKLKNNKLVLEKQLAKEMSMASKFVSKQSQYNYEQLDIFGSSGNFDNYITFNYLIELSVYFEVLDGNYETAETLLLDYFMFSRKITESSLDLITSINFVVNIEQLFQPLLEQLVKHGHSFSSSLGDYFYPISMQEITLQKVAVSEANMMYRSITSYLEVDSDLKKSEVRRWTIYIGYKPIMTVNKISNFWMQATIPSNTKKSDYLKIKTNTPSFLKISDNNFKQFLMNPKNFLGELVAAASIPRYLDAGIDYALKDLNLLLFKLLINSQNQSVVELISEKEYIDPYTGNNPYIEDNKICYPAWEQLKESDHEYEATCIRFSGIQ